MIDYRKLAVLFLRCTGLLWVLGGIATSGSYLPAYLESRHVKGNMSLFNALVLPSLGTVVVGLVLLLFAGVLGRLMARGLE